MPVAVTCPECGASFTARPARPGGHFPCPACGKRLAMPPEPAQPTPRRRVDLAGVFHTGLWTLAALWTLAWTLDACTLSPVEYPGAMVRCGVMLLGGFVLAESVSRLLRGPGRE